jgi:hypothetical protein
MGGMDGTRSTHGRDEIHFGRRTSGEETTLEDELIREDNIKMDFREVASRCEMDSNGSR